MLTYEQILIEFQQEDSPLERMMWQCFSLLENCTWAEQEYFGTRSSPTEEELLYRYKRLRIELLDTPVEKMKGDHFMISMRGFHACVQLGMKSDPEDRIAWALFLLWQRMDRIEKAIREHGEDLPPSKPFHEEASDFVMFHSKVIGLLHVRDMS